MNNRQLAKRLIRLLKQEMKDNSKGKKMKKVKNIDLLDTLYFIFIAFTVSFMIGLFITIYINRPLTDERETRRVRICKTYSTDFWRNDIDYIDGKCYYRGKEVEIK